MMRKKLVLPLFLLLGLYTYPLYPGDVKKDTLHYISGCGKIKSGLFCTIGYSALYLNDEILPEYFTSEYYTFTHDLFISVGAFIKFHPEFLASGWQLRSDPAFAKYSYGSHHEQVHGNITTAVDIDIETIRIPVSVQYDFLQKNTRFHPFLRGGYSFAYFITYDALLNGTIDSGENTEEFTNASFDFARFQNSLFISGGIDLRIWESHFTLEVVLEKGDGIHAEKYGDSFMKASYTSNYYLQLGVLF